MTSTAADAGPRIASLCSGYGGLEIAIRAGLGGHVVVGAENNAAAAAVFEHHHPGVPNLGDITKADWDQVREQHRPDVLAAGFPCTDISNAGKRIGIHGKRSGIWKNVAAAVRSLRPGIVFLENVAAIRSRGLDVVAGDLAALGYDARWTCLRAGDPETGAPHPRDRWFGIAYPAAEDADLAAWGERWTAAPREAEGGWPRADAGGRGGVPAALSAGAGAGRPLSLIPTPASRDWKSGASNLFGRNSRPLNEFAVNMLGQVRLPDAQWVGSNGLDYGPAVRRWEAVTGFPAPEPTEPGVKCNRRLSPLFTEWLMGLEPGYVTGVVPERNDQLVILGNGVVWRQAHHAYGLLLGAHRPSALSPA